MTEENKVDVSKYELTYQPLNILNVIIALLIPTAVGYLSIVLLTNSTNKPLYIYIKRIMVDSGNLARNIVSRRTARRIIGRNDRYN
jgi:hypothetical protein